MKDHDLVLVQKEIEKIKGQWTDEMIDMLINNLEFHLMDKNLIGDGLSSLDEGDKL